MRWRELARREGFLYAFITLVLGGVALVSLHRPGYIAGGDIWPAAFIPGNQVLQESLRLWGDTITGLGSPQFNPGSFLMGLWGSFWLNLGLSGPTVEFLFMAALLIWEGLGVTFFVRTLFPEQRFAALAAGLGLPLSLYNTLVFADPVQAFAIGFFPWLAAFLIRRLRRPVANLRLGAELGLASLGFMFLATTPPVAVYAAVWAAFWTGVGLWRWRTLRMVWPGLAGGGLLALALNGWWAYAAYITLYGTGGGVQQAFAGPLAWGFVDSRASLANLLSMQGFWGWPMPMYVPWAGIYGQGMLHWALYLPALFAMVGLVWSKRRRLTGMLLGILLVSLFLAKGLHAPLSQVNVFLYQHLPFFWLLRDPQMELDISLYLALFTLAGLGVSEAWDGLKILCAKLALAGGRKLTVGGSAAALLLLSQCLSGYALASGVFIPPTTLFGQAKSVVQIPKYWFAAAHYLNQHVKNSRILLLPNDDSIYMPYDWGYYGADGVAQTLIHHPVVTVNPSVGGYLAAANYQVVQQQLLKLIEAGPGVPLAPALRALGIGWILERKDVNWSMPGRQILSVPYLTWYLQKQPGIRQVATFGQEVIYRVKGGATPAQAYTAAGKWLGSDIPELAEASALLGENVPWLQGGQAAQIPTSAYGWAEAANIDPAPPRQLPSSGTVWLQPKTVAVRVQEVSSRELLVDIVGPQYRIGGKKQGWGRTLQLALPSSLGVRQVLDVGGQRFFFRRSQLAAGRQLNLGTYTIPFGISKISVDLWTSQGGNLVASVPWSSVGDCNAYNKQSMAAAKIWSRTGEETTVLLHAVTDAACVAKGVGYQSGRHGALLLAVDYRHVAGVSPQTAVLLNNKVVDHAYLPSNSSWQRWRQWVPVQGSGSASLFTYAYGTGKTTLEEYRRAGIWGMQRVAESSFSTAGIADAVSAGRLTIMSGGQSNPSKLIPGFTSARWGGVFNGDAYLPMTNAQAGLRAEVLPGDILDLQARQDGAGDGIAISGVGGRVLDLVLEARAVHGTGPTAVLFDQRGRVIWQSNFIGGTHKWQKEHAIVDMPPNQQAQLFLYAYSNGTFTEDQFRNLSLKTWPPGRGSLLWVGGKPSRSLPLGLQGGNTKYRANVSPGARLLVLDNSYDPGWVAEAGGKILPWKHVPVDGFLNGWLVPADAPSQVVLRYAPASFFDSLRWVALAGLVLTLVLLGRLLWREVWLGRTKELG